MNFAPLFLLLGCLCLFLRPTNAQIKVPTATKIEEYDDPMLDQIFAETNAMFPDPGFDAAPIGGALATPLPHAAPEVPKITPPTLTTPPPIGLQNVGIDPNSRPAPGAVFSNPGFNPDQQTGLLGPVGLAHPQGGQLGAGGGNAMPAWAGPWSELAGRGAQQFYQGVRAAGRLLGIDAGQYRPYEVPLISQGARFFGRRRR